MKTVRVQAGLLDFEYTVSLHIEHFDLDPEVLSRSLKLTTRRSHKAGEPRQTPQGTPLAGTYETAYWYAELEPQDGDDVAAFLSRLAEELAPAKHLLSRIVDYGGTVECFIGLFANGMCDQILPSSVLLKLGELGISLRLDYCGQSVEVSSLLRSMQESS